MIKSINVKTGVELEHYDLYSNLAMPLRELHTEASTYLPQLKNKKIWMINSTSIGGGVAEMMPRLISFFRQLGLEAEWLVASSENKDYFHITKKIHNLIHSEGDDKPFTEDERKIYENVNEENANELLKLIKPGDIVVIHDPQPIAMIQFLKSKIDVKFLWRCHIGIDSNSSRTKLGWNFLEKYIKSYDLCIYSAAEYIPKHIIERAMVMSPSIDPLDHKNRDLPIHKVVGILCNSKTITEYQPVLTSPFTETVTRLQTDGSFQSALFPTDAGILYKPMVLQISRWDKLKGFLPLIKGFQELRKNISRYSLNDKRHEKRLELVHLVLAGPDPEFVEDDPEGVEVLKELCDYYVKLPNYLQEQISILKLPMSSRKHNELIVNALQRLSTIVVQNSLRESFGLTVTEAMWKAKPVLGSAACGIKKQIREKIDGAIIDNPSDPIEIAMKLNHSLSCPKEREVWAHNAQKRVIEKYLIFHQISHWLKSFASL